MASRGAKGKYEDWLTPDGLKRIEGWARDGLNDEQIAFKMGVSKTTFYKWKREYAQFSDALKKGKAPVDCDVENALLKSALGFTVTVKRPIKLKKRGNLKGKGAIEEERIEIVDEEIYIKPDVTAQIFWLKNRKPEQWREKREYVGASDGAISADVRADVERAVNGYDGGKAGDNQLFEESPD